MGRDAQKQFANTSLQVLACSFRAVVMAVPSQYCSLLDHRQPQRREHGC